MLCSLCSVGVITLASLFVACLASGSSAESKSTFLASFSDEVSGKRLAKVIQRHAADPSIAWTGAVTHAHEAIRVLVIEGESKTCELVTKIKGVLHCEPDSIVTNV